MILFEPKLFNWLLIALMICAALRWSFDRNLWQTVYWAAAAALNIAVTGMGK